MLDYMAQKLLTVKFQEEILAEIAAAAHVFRSRSVSELIHQLALKAIAEARAQVPSSKWALIVAEKMMISRQRSKLKSPVRVKKIQKAAFRDLDIIGEAVPPTHLSDKRKAGKRHV